MEFLIPLFSARRNWESGSQPMHFGLVKWRGLHLITKLYSSVDQPQNKYLHTWPMPKLEQQKRQMPSVNRRKRGWWHLHPTIISPCLLYVARSGVVRTICRDFRSFFPLLPPFPPGLLEEDPKKLQCRNGIPMLALLKQQTSTAKITTFSASSPQRSNLKDFYGEACVSKLGA